MILGLFFGLHWLSGTKTLQFSVKTFFFGLHLILETKTLQIFREDFFFCLHLICLRENNSGRASSPPMLKMGRNCKLYPPMLDIYGFETTRSDKTMEKGIVTFKHNYRSKFSPFLAKLLATNCCT